MWLNSATRSPLGDSTELGGVNAGDVHSGLEREVESRTGAVPAHVLEGALVDVGDEVAEACRRAGLMP